MSPAIIILTSVGVFAIAGIPFCVWRRFTSFRVFWSLWPYILVPQRRERKDDWDPENGRPEIFDAWTERYNPNSLKWEEYTPFSVTVLTASGPARKVGKLRGNSAVGKGGRGRNDQESCRLQVGVLVAMPSQLHTKHYDGVGEDLSRSALRDGLAIGLVKMPWIDGDS